MDKSSVSAVGGLMVVGCGVGAALGAAMDNIPVYTAIGIAVGIILGFGIDMNRRRNSE